MEKRTEEGKKSKMLYIRNYNKENYDRINLCVEKGLKNKIKDLAAQEGLSVSSYIIKCIEYFEDTKKKGR